MDSVKKKKIILTGGGTLGHAIPLINLVKSLGNDHYEYAWFGERDSYESELAQKNNIDFYDISAGKIRRYFDIRNFYEPLKNLTGIVESLYYMLRYKGDIVFSKGGFVSLPVCIAAFILRKKVYIHESDAVLGLANKICSGFATNIFTSFPIEHKKALHTGPILNVDMLESVESTEINENEILNILVIAGSQGSETIIESINTIVHDCRDIHFTVITGKAQNDEVIASLKNMPNVVCHELLSQDELAKIYISTDIAVTRGSSTLWELLFFGIHSIIVPHKYTGGNHQQKNAEYFHDIFGSDILDEDDNLHLEIFRKLQSYKDLRKTGLNLEGYLDGVKKIEGVLSES